MLITHSLARRLEMAEAADGACCAEAEWILNPRSNAAVKSVAGGFVMFLGPTSPLSHALGIGMHGPVTEQDLDEIEDFYSGRDSPTIIDLCPHADVSLRELLTAREYTASEFANVLVRPLQPDEVLPDCASDVEVRPAEPVEIESWAEMIVRGFFERDTLTEDELHLGRLMFSIPFSTPYIATIYDEPAGGSGLSLRKGVANFYSDAVLPRFRRRGVQTCLIRARIAAAIAAGCDIATAGTLPGSTSQLNYQRLGFQVAYTKTTMIRA